MLAGSQGKETTDTSRFGAALGSRSYLLRVGQPFPCCPGNRSRLPRVRQPLRRCPGSRYSRSRQPVRSCRSTLSPGSKLAPGQTSRPLAPGQTAQSKTGWHCCQPVPCPLMCESYRLTNFGSYSVLCCHHARDSHHARHLLQKQAAQPQQMPTQTDTTAATASNRRNRLAPLCTRNSARSFSMLSIALLT